MTTIERTKKANLGFMLTQALRRWNELLYDGYRRRGYEDVRPAYGTVLLPLFDEEGLHMGELAQRARLSKQTVTTLIRDMRDKGLVRRIRDPDDARAYRIYLSNRARSFRGVAEEVLTELHQRIEQSLSPDAAAVLRRSLGKLATFPSVGDDGS
jgi:DNA-binding MarR family transcriptional regulator